MENKYRKLYYSIAGVFSILLLSIIAFTMISPQNVEIGDTDKDVILELISENKNEDFIKWKNNGEIEKIIAFYETKTEPSDTDLYELAELYLDYANYFYKENDFSIKARGVLGQIEETSFKKLYLLGYSHEILKNYDQALTYYLRAQKLVDISKEEQAIVLNQIGHTYDLQGDMEAAYREYYNSYIIDNNIHASVNIARYFARKGELESALSYFEYALEKKPSAFLQSEIYFSIASIYIEQKNYIDAVKNAEMSIQANKNYPMGHYILARVLYISNENFDYKTLSELLNKSIELNANNSQAYELLALVEYEESNDIEKAKGYLQQAIDRVDSDILFMDSSRSNYKLNYFNQYTFVLGIDKKDLTEYLSSTLASAYPIGLQVLRKNKGLLQDIPLKK